MIRRLMIMTATLGLLLTGAAAMEIPLGSATIFGGAGGDRTSIGYVDIEKVFAEHPMKKRLQEEFLAEVEKRRKEISGLDQEIDNLEKVIVSTATEINRAKLELDILRMQAAEAEAASSSALRPGATESMLVPQGEVNASSITAPSRGFPALNPAVIDGKEAALKDKEAGLEALRAELDKRKDEMAQRIKQNKAELALIEEKNTADVLADLYQILQRAATDEGVTIVIDKSDVLYGQAGRDLTDKVRERLQGR